MLAFIFALALVIIVGLAFAGMAGVVLHVVISFGIFSLSSLIAWYNKSVSLGAKWFLQLMFVVPGLMVGVLGCFVYQGVFNEKLSFTYILLMGIAVGALAFFQGQSLFTLSAKLSARLL